MNKSVFEQTIERIRFINIDRNPAWYQNIPKPVVVKPERKPRKTRAVTTVAPKEPKPVKLRSKEYRQQEYRKKQPIVKQKSRPINTPEGYKFCLRGDHYELLENFTDRKLSKDGKFHWCKECTRKYRSEYRKNKTLSKCKS